MLYLLLLLIPLLIYSVLAATIFFHLRKYGIAGDLTKQITAVFVTISAVLIIFTGWSFFNIPWSKLNLIGILRNFLQNSPFLNQ